MLNNMEEKIYLLCSGGMIEAPEDWYKGLKESEFVDSYEGLLQGGYMHPSSEQIEFNLANPNLDLYNAFYMIPKDTAVVNEEIRKHRENLYNTSTDRLYMAYVKYREFNYQNVFFTLFIGLLTMIAYRAVEEKEEWGQAWKVILYILIVAAGMALAYFLKTDYAEKGVFCIMVLYIFRKKKMWQLIAGCASFIWETPALFGFIPIAFYNGTRGWKMKYFFYIFYPAHLLILYLLCYFMGISGYSAV